MTAFIFDVDGTLAETERQGHRVAFNRAFTEAGLNWYWSDALYGELLAISGGKERIRHYMTHYAPDDRPSNNVEEFIKQLHQSKSHHYRQMLQQGHIPFRPGVKRLITEAKQAGMGLAVATTSAYESAIALMASNLGDTKDFELIAAGDVVANKKPAGDIYHYVLDNMGLNPQECLVFEDSQHGLEAATQAGLKTVVTVNDYTRHQDFSDAVLVLNHLGEPDHPFTLYGDHPEVTQTYFDVELGKRLINS